MALQKGRRSWRSIKLKAVDGMDVLKMYDAVKDAADDCRAGKGPVLLEANTYRFRGHSVMDPATYRSKEEAEEERKKQEAAARAKQLA